MHNCLYLISNLERLYIVHRDLKQYKQSSIGVNQIYECWILVSAYNAESFTASQTLLHFKLPSNSLTCSNRNAQLLMFDHLIWKNYSTQRYQTI